VSRRKALTDIKAVKTAITTFIDDKTPTMAGLLRVLGIQSKHTLYNYIDEESEIGDYVRDAYLHIIECHEKRLFASSANGSMWALKQFRKLGFDYSDNPDNNTHPVNNDRKITLEIINDRDIKTL